MGLYAYSWSSVRTWSQLIPTGVGGAVGVTAGSGVADVVGVFVACAEAAHLAARTALQVHGAIGYTQECDLSLWLLKVRALRTAWGTPDQHRARVLAALTATRS